MLSDKLKIKLNCPDLFLKFFIGVSILWFICCIGLLIPSLRNPLIQFGEYIIHRPLRDPPNWHNVLSSFSIQGITLYLIFSIVFFYNNSLSQFISGKKLLIFLIVIAVLYCYFIMFRANWTFGDEHMFIYLTAANKYIPFSRTIFSGRFFPLGCIHYNLPLFVYRCLGINTGLPVEVHFMVNVVFFIITFLFLYLLINKIKPFENNEYCVFNLFFISTLFLLGRQLTTVFLNLVFPEVSIIMLFSIFMLMYYKALETDRIKYYVAALLTVIYSSYCKEPVFGVFLVIALFNFIFKYNKLAKQEKIFYMALVANAVIFLVLYYYLSYRNTTDFYGTGIMKPELFGYLYTVVSQEPIIVVIFPFCLVRLYFIILKKDREHLYYDSLLFAGTAYICAHFLLKFSSGYYFSPAVFLFIPSLVYWIKYLYNNRIVFSLCLLFILLPIYAFNWTGTKASVKSIYKSRQEFMPYVSDLLSLYNDDIKFIWYESDNSVLDYTHWITVRSWRKSIENIFLNYLNKTERYEFFITKKSIDDIDMTQKILFFYPEDNDQYQPISDKIVKALKDNGFEIYEDSYGILIYRN